MYEKKNLPISVHTVNNIHNSNLEGGVSGEDPEHHGDPVEDHHQEHPVREHARVKHQDHHSEQIVFF